MSYLLITKERKTGARVLLVAPAGADPLRYVQKGERLLQVAKAPAGQVIGKPCKTGSALVLAH